MPAHQSGGSNPYQNLYSSSRSGSNGQSGPPGDPQLWVERTTRLAPRASKKWGKLAASADRAAAREMRHMTHSSVSLWPKTALESAQCDTVFAQNDGRIGVMAKKQGRTGA
jgi:hypothetical protein